jgi:hypothetical protein
VRGMKDLFAGRHFDRDVIILCVRWCGSYTFCFPSGSVATDPIRRPKPSQTIFAINPPCQPVRLLPNGSSTVGERDSRSERTNGLEEFPWNY